jgi:hypothetical protein
LWRSTADIQVTSHSVAEPDGDAEDKVPGAVSRHLAMGKGRFC